MNTTLTRFFSASVAVACSVFSAHALPIFAPTDPIQGGQVFGTDFFVGVAGTAAGQNNWPAGEAPNFNIDGFGQKYLNFGELNTGFVVTPGFNSGNGSIATSIKLWTANDAEPRDPASFSLYGTNVAITGGGPFALSDFTLISSGGLSLPSSRNGGGTATPLDDLNSQTVPFANSAAYRSYLVIFPTVKDELSANSMQIAEVQLDGVPEPSAIALLCLTTAGLAALRRRRR